MWATFVGTPGDNTWSNPAAWASGAEPGAGTYLNIRLRATSTVDLGSVSAPLLTNDVAGPAGGTNDPGLTIAGFLHAHDLSNIADLRILSSGHLTVRHNLADVQNLLVSNAGSIVVGNDLANVQAIEITFDSRVEVGHDVGDTVFNFGIGGGTLVLANPDHQSLDNKLALGIGVAGINIELGHVRFDQARFIATKPGRLTGRIDLLTHGQVAYTLTHVTEIGQAGKLTVGVDKADGYDVLSYHS